VALTLAEAQQLRANYLAALNAIASGQSYTIGTRQLTRANLAEVKKSFAEYDQLVEQLKSGRGGGIPVRRIMPRDL
jgi:pyridoxine/pyridoxamine 5'-phosphate oxidase